jgi:uncharacterized LabA/DUF88 family protein
MAAPLSRGKQVGPGSPATTMSSNAAVYLIPPNSPPKPRSRRHSTASNSSLSSPMTDANIAVLIDADNVSYRHIGGLMAEIANIGKASVRRIYGDWTSDQMKGWKECLLNHSFTPMQQFAYTTGKNATDGAMIIDAMDLLYTGRFSTFCIISSDSDFTRLAGRIREQGVTVYGFGKRNTVNAFVAACDKFVYFDVLPGLEGDEEESPVESPEDAGTKEMPPGRPARLDRGPPGTYQIPFRTPAAPVAVAKHPVGNIRTPFGKPRPLDRAALEGLRKAIASSIGDDSEYAYLAEVGIRLARISPDLNARNYGYQNLRGLVEASGIADLKTKTLEGKPPVSLVRLKESHEGVRLF